MPVPALSEEYMFNGWTLNGTLLESNNLTLDTEGDVVLVASAVKRTDTTSTETVPEHTDTEPQKETHNSSPKTLLWILLAGALLAIAAYVAIRFRKNSLSLLEQSEEKDIIDHGEENDDEQGSPE